MASTPFGRGESVDPLQVRNAFEDEDAAGQPVRMLGFPLDPARRISRELADAPMVQHAGVQEMQVDGAERMGELEIEEFDHLGVAQHGLFSPSRRLRAAASSRPGLYRRRASYPIPFIRRKDAPCRDRR
ncbi:hypothetical protein AcidC75_13260 [Acidisoma sp. C75]